MDEQRQPEGSSGHADGVAWRVNGAHNSAGHAVARGAEQAWSSAGEALEPAAEPLALLTNHAGTASASEARHRRSTSSGMDDDTPISGTPAVEPPLWREAARYAPSPGAVYDTRYGEYPPPPPFDPATGGGLPPPPPAAPGPPAPPESVPPLEPAGLPQRVPAEPDVPVSGEPDPGVHAGNEGADRDRWTAPELAWIADQLRRDDVPGERPPETFDVDAVVAAVREVDGVRAASVRANPTGMHTLRLDLADDADPGQVSRSVARLLLERMGLSTAPQHVPHARTPEGTVAPPEPEPQAPPPLAPPLTPPPAPPPAPEGWVPPAARVPEESWAYQQPEPPAPPAQEAQEAEARLGAAPPEDADAPEPDGMVDPMAYGMADGLIPPPPEDQPEVVSRPLLGGQSGPRVVIDQVQVSTFGLEASVQVQLTAGERRVTGVADGPAVDSYLVRLAAVAAAKAIDDLLRGVAEPGGPSRCFIEHTGTVSFGSTEVVVAVVLLVCGGWVEQLTGSALVDGDPRQAVVRATLGAVNRRLEALLD